MQTNAPPGAPTTGDLETLTGLIATTSSRLRSATDVASRLLSAHRGDGVMPTAAEVAAAIESLQHPEGGRFSRFFGQRAAQTGGKSFRAHLDDFLSQRAAPRGRGTHHAPKEES